MNEHTFDYTNLYCIFDHEKYENEHKENPWENRNREIAIDWGCELGFGQLTIEWNPKKEKWEIDSERMSREFVISVLKSIVDNAEMDWEKE
jgi:hypothetical protein